MIDIHLEELKDFYTRNPDLFIEEFLNIKLLPYQKILIRLLTSKQNNFCVRQKSRNNVKTPSVIQEVHMKLFRCDKCGSTDVFIKKVGTQIGLYCGDCGTWIKWLRKDEIRLAERQISKLNEKNNSGDKWKLKNLKDIDVLPYVTSRVDEQEVNLHTEYKNYAEKCKDSKPSVITNFERIKNMTIDEFVDEILINVPDDCDTRFIFGSWKNRKQIKHWLEIEVET